MKRFIAIVLLVAVLCGTLAVQAYNDSTASAKEVLAELNIIDENYFSNSNVITREECLIAVMRVIGLTDEDVEKLNGADLISFADTGAFTYFGCADLSGIAYGEECIVDYPTERTRHTLKNTDFFFFPNRVVTVEETLAFMVRCLGANNDEDIQNIVEKAKEYALINSEDIFIKDVGSAISQDDFYILLDRLLHQRRYKYYERLDDGFRMDGNIDEERSMTYLEFLTQR